MNGTQLKLEIPNQPVIDYTRVLHTHENNRESQQQLEDNKFRFTGQCAFVWSLLLKGVKLTSRDAMLKYNIGHLARRIKDLKDALKKSNSATTIECEYPEGEDGKKLNHKVYYIRMV